MCYCTQRRFLNYNLISNPLDFTFTLCLFIKDTVYKGTLIFQKFPRLTLLKQQSKACLLKTSALSESDCSPLFLVFSHCFFVTYFYFVFRRPDLLIIFLSHEKMPGTLPSLPASPHSDTESLLQDLPNIASWLACLTLLQVSGAWCKDLYLAGFPECGNGRLWNPILINVSL